MAAPVDADFLETLLLQRAEFVRFVRSRVDNETVAEEIVQTAFLRGVEHASEVRDDESSVAWFYRSLRNAIVDYYRRRDAAARAHERASTDPAFDRSVPSPDEKSRVCQCVRALARTLKPEYASILEHVDIEDRPLGEVAAEEGITANNATVRLHRARKALRERVTTTCRACAEHGCLDCTCKHEV